jgi:hypothetical protein
MEISESNSYQPFPPDEDNSFLSLPWDDQDLVGPQNKNSYSSKDFQSILRLTIHFYHNIIINYL